MPEGNEQTTSYRNIFKATTLFGGVQVYQILISVIRSKFVAVLLGTAGVGLLGLYQSTVGLVQSITSLGLSQSAVRDVSEANGSGDMERIGRTVSAFRKLVWFTGLLGMAAVIVLSPVLSKTTFGNYDYTIPLIILSCTLLIDQLASGQKVVLQGMRRLKELARASAIGVTLGLVFSVPLYYAFGVKGIVPTLILNSAASFTLFWCFSRKIRLPKAELTVKETWLQGKSMVRMGVAMSASSIFSTAVSYVIRTFIMHRGGAETVGLYQAGFVIINTYVGMVFSAVGTDFYPRLAAINQDDAECRKVVSQQGEIATQILAPMLCGCVLLMPLLLKILYSDRFLDASPYILWCCPGMMFRLASWLIAFQFVAKSESRLYFLTEIAGGVLILSMSLLGYYWDGLKGLGIAFSLNYFFYFILVYILASRRYGFSFSESFVISYLIQMFLVAAALASVEFVGTNPKYWICAVLTIFSCGYALFVLNKKMGLLEMLRDRLIIK